MINTRALNQQAPGAALAAQDLTINEDEAGTLLEVVACAPSQTDIAPTKYSWPRVPGGVFAGDDPQGQRWLCGGLLPCGQCPGCQTAHHESCSHPYLPGTSADVPGGLATHVVLPRSGHLAPLPTEDDVHGAVALVASAGLTYQATASAGMVPGDTVFVLGDVGPGSLPLRTLAALGLCPVWITGDPGNHPPDGIQLAGGLEDLPETSSPRCHTLDLSPCDRALEQAVALADRCLTLTFAMPSLPDGAAPPLERLLAGPVTVRWVTHLHPHLVLDLAALALTKELELSPFVDALSLGEFPEAWETLMRGEADRWPVLVGRS